MEDRQLRRRMADEKSGSESVESTAGKAQRKLALKLDWELLFWMIAAFATLYFTNFASNVLFNDKINRILLVASLLLVGVAIITMMCAVRRHPRLDHTNWPTTAPIPTATATLACVSGGILFVVSVWPVWGMFTLLIVPVLVMGAVSTVSIFNL